MQKITVVTGDSAETVQIPVTRGVSISQQVGLMFDFFNFLNKAAS